MYIATCETLMRTHYTHSPTHRHKISDFGMSRDVGTDASAYYSTKRGLVPLRWTAPECLGKMKFSSASDVWAFGVLCGEVFDGGARPFDNMSDQEVWLFVQSGRGIACPASCPIEVYARLIAPCFLAEPSARPTFAQIGRRLLRFSEQPPEIEMARNNSTAAGDVFGNFFTPHLHWWNSNSDGDAMINVAANPQGGYVYASTVVGLRPASYYMQRNALVSSATLEMTHFGGGSQSSRHTSCTFNEYTDEQSISGLSFSQQPVDSISQQMIPELNDVFHDDHEFSQQPKMRQQLRDD